MAEHRWLKFWPQDWEGDECLKVCSLAARGLWIAMICLMNRATPYGHLLINGRAPTDRKLAALVGASEKEVTAALRELEEEGVFSRTPEGVIVSRRMLKDKVASDRGKRTGTLGGNPTLTGGVNPPIKGETLTGDVIQNQTGQVNGGPNVQEAEAESESEAEKERRKKEAKPLTLDSVLARATGWGSQANGAGPPRWEDEAIVPAGLDPKKPADHPDNVRDRDRPTVNGFFLDSTFEKAMDAARINPAKSKATRRPVIEWLKDGIEPSHIYRAIERCTERDGYTPPQTLAYFDRPVREFRADRAA